jgi:hypothetical protein
VNFRLCNGPGIEVIELPLSSSIPCSNQKHLARICSHLQPKDNKSFPRTAWMKRICRKKLLKDRGLEAISISQQKLLRVLGKMKPATHGIHSTVQSTLASMAVPCTLHVGSRPALTMMMKSHSAASTRYTRIGSCETSCDGAARSAFGPFRRRWRRTQKPFGPSSQELHDKAHDRLLCPDAGGIALVIDLRRCR